MSQIRPAVTADVPKIVDLCEAGRRRYAGGHTNYYAVAPDFAAKKSPAVDRLVGSSDALSIVHETGGLIDGVVLGIVVNAPPVYDPGGKVCLIEDFVVTGDGLWSTAGVALTMAANDFVRAQGGVLLIAECMTAAEAKLNRLLSSGFSIATDWFCRDIDLTAPAANIDGAIERATTGDVSAILALCERQRMKYQEYQPVFWRKAADSAPHHEGRLSWMLGQETTIGLVHRTGAGIDGFIIADPVAASPFFDRGGTSCNVDDFNVAGDDLWAIGAWLLYTAAREAKTRGAACTQVICGDAHSAKRAMLEKMGYEIGHYWTVRATA